MKDRKARYAITKDNFRVDVGVLIDRNQIFLNYDKEEMDLKKFRYYLSEKYKNRIELPKELLDFAEKSPTEEYYKHDVDNIPTHYK